MLVRRRVCEINRSTDGVLKMLGNELSWSFASPTSPLPKRPCVPASLRPSWIADWVSVDATLESATHKILSYSTIIQNHVVNGWDYLDRQYIMRLAKIFSFLLEHRKSPEEAINNIEQLISKPIRVKSKPPRISEDAKPEDAYRAPNYTCSYIPPEDTLEATLTEPYSPAPGHILKSLGIKTDTREQPKTTLASKLEFKTVNKEPLTAKVNTLDDYVFVIRTRINRETKDPIFYIDIKSEDLRDVLREVLKDVYRISLLEDKPRKSPRFINRLYKEDLYSYDRASPLALIVYKTFSKASIELVILKFRGPKRINSLLAFPLKYYLDEKQVKSDLVKYSRKFVRLIARTRLGNSLSVVYVGGPPPPPLGRLPRDHVKNDNVKLDDLTEDDFLVYCPTVLAEFAITDIEDIKWSPSPYTCLSIPNK
ncbi:hypothetical protein G7Y89_g9463 [Cudoniella acicularis]|uniref:Uncharacterized protein n=1 Tax=Cudoniella acicularis TaxID=354080 RepID=A0A8H4RGX3_9HELO|nr:hypothetical protein G7Y89_g9463 [Cudoniella acicularis]